MQSVVPIATRQSLVQCPRTNSPAHRLLTKGILAKLPALGATSEFRDPNKPLLATLAAIEMHTHENVLACYLVLRQLAQQFDGIDYLQVFEDDTKDESLWFIEDGDGGAITSLLLSDY